MASLRRGRNRSRRHHHPFSSFSPPPSLSSTSFSRRVLAPMLRPSFTASASSPPPSSDGPSSPFTPPRRPPRSSSSVLTSPSSPAAAVASAAARQKLTAEKARARARRENDSMIYLDGPQVYACAQCRTHLTSHDDIISKSFHGRHGRAYLFDQCVNITTSKPEDRLLITGLHSVCDIFCKRCKNILGWTYSKAYEPSQKYKEGKFIIEKINLFLEENYYYANIESPAGERIDRFRKRSMSWGDDTERNEIVYEYRPFDNAVTTDSSNKKEGVASTTATAVRSPGAERTTQSDTMSSPSSSLSARLPPPPPYL